MIGLGYFHVKPAAERACCSLETFLKLQYGTFRLFLPILGIFWMEGDLLKKEEEQRNEKKKRGLMASC